MIFQIDFHQTAAEHKAGDAACGRPWQCTCAACIQVREGMTKADWLKKLVAEKQKSMHVRVRKRRAH